MTSTTKELKSVTKSVKTVRNTLFEMLGPQSDGFEESKLSLLLGMNSCGNLNAERERIKKNQSTMEFLGEDLSTIDCNLSGNDFSKKFDESKKSNVLANVEDSGMNGNYCFYINFILPFKITLEIKFKNSNDENSLDCNSRSNPNFTFTKSAFRSIKDKNPVVNYSITTDTFSLKENDGLNDCFPSNLANGFISADNMNRNLKKSTNHDTSSDVYSLNLTTNNYNHTNSNNYQNNNFQNNSTNKQILFTSIKNNYRKEKKLANQVNFQIIKTNQNFENAMMNNNQTSGLDKIFLLCNNENEGHKENMPNLNHNPHENSMTLGSLSTNLNSQASINSIGHSAFYRNGNLINSKPPLRENISFNETLNSPLENDINTKEIKNTQKSTQTNSSKLNIASSNLFDENSYLKFLIIAAETLMAKGLQFLEEIQIDDKESFSSGINGDKIQQKREEQEILEENLKLKSESDSNDYPSNISMKTFSKISSCNKLTGETGPESIRKCDNKVCGVIASKKLNWCKVKINKSKHSWLCKACFKAWKNNQFCYYCNVIYSDNTNTSNYNDNKSWIQCDFCEMWQHIQCEEAKGFYSDLSECLTDSDFKYMCPVCRCKNESKFHESSRNTNGDRKKNKTKYNKPPNEINQDFLGQKTRSDKDLDIASK